MFIYPSNKKDVIKIQSFIFNFPKCTAEPRDLVAREIDATEAELYPLRQRHEVWRRSPGSPVLLILFPANSTRKSSHGIIMQLQLLLNENPLMELDEK